MTFRFGLAIVAGLVIGSTPALAMTVVPSASMPAGRQFVDPDAALDDMSTSMRDEARMNNIQGVGGRTVIGSMNFDGGTAESSGDTLSEPPSSHGSIHAWGVMPALSGPELYDQEPPFMPVVVGDFHR